MALQVIVTTPDGLVHRGECLKVIVPAHDGEMGILPHHAPLIGTLGAGELRVTPAEGPLVQSFFVAGGFFQVFRDRVVVLATRAEPGSSLNPSLAQEELRLLLAEALPGGIDAETRTVRMEKVRIARARAKVAAKNRDRG